MNRIFCRHGSRTDSHCLAARMPDGSRAQTALLWPQLSYSASIVRNRTRYAESIAMRPGLGQLLLAMLSVALAFVLVLSAAFWVSGHNPALASKTRAVNSGVFAGLTVFALVFTAAVIARLFGIPIGIRKHRFRRYVTRQSNIPSPPRLSAAFQQQKNDYANSPSMTVTCAHLQPIERAMRGAGVAVVPTAQTVVKASCESTGPACCVSLRRSIPLTTPSTSSQSARPRTSRSRIFDAASAIPISTSTIRLNAVSTRVGSRRRLLR